MIKKFEVSRNKPFKYLIEVFNTDTNKLKYIIATGKVIQVDCELNPKSDNIIQCYDNLKDALIAYEK